MKSSDFIGGPETTRGKKLLKYLEKHKVTMARDISSIASSYELKKDENWWLNDISKQVLDGDDFGDLRYNYPTTWGHHIDAWNATPEYYANIIWTELITRFKKFAHYRRQ